MKSYIETLKKEHIAYKIITAALLTVIAFFMLRVVRNTIIGLDYPNEILEPANIHFTNTLINGNIPYERENIVEPGQEPPINYEYPFLNNMFAAAFSYLTGGNTIAAHYLVSFLAMIGTAILGASIINRYSRTTVGPTAGFLLLLFCHWRYGYISASPDGFGLLVTMMTLYCATRPQTRYRALKCALLTVACFYSKQYFAGVCVAIFIYMWCYSKKEALKYFGWCVGTLTASVIIVTAVWPLYWDYSLLCLLHGTFQGWDAKGFINVINQIKYLSFIFAGMLVVLAVATYRFVRDKARKISVESDNTAPQTGTTSEKCEQSGRRRVVAEGKALPLFLIQIPVQTIILFFVGRNDGAYLTYFLQLLIPSLVIATFIIMEQMKIERREVVFVSCYSLMVIFTVYFGWAKLPMHMLTDEDIANWKRAYALIDEYREKGKVYHFQTTAYNGIENGDSVFCTGHDGDISEKSYLDWKNNEIQKLLFPNAGMIFEENITYRRTILDRIYSNEISIITTGEDDTICFSRNDLKSAGYEIVDTIALQVGNTSIDTLFWAIEE